MFEDFLASSWNWGYETPFLEYFFSPARIRTCHSTVFKLKTITALTLQTDTKFVGDWLPSTSFWVFPASMLSYTAPAKWNLLVMVPMFHDFFITQDLRVESFFLLSNINKTHVNWLLHSRVKAWSPCKSASRRNKEAIMMAIACNPSYCRGRAGGARVQTQSKKSRPAQNI